MKLARHTLYNLLGLGLPLVVAVFCIPILVSELGVTRFGLLTLIWAVVSYFGLFDLGLGRALTQLLAVALVEHDEKRIGSLVATATALMAGLGFFAGLLIALLAPWGVGLIQSVPDQQEVINAVLLMALAMPAIVLTSGFRGILEARDAFGVINLIRLPMGLLTFVGPVVVVIYGSTRLDMVTGVLAVGRIIACVVHAWFAWRVLPNCHGKFVLSKTHLKPLCVSGGWMTLSNIVSPFMGYVDRFIIGGVVSAAAVAYYTTPQEIILRLWILPGALTAVLFPAFAAQIAVKDGKTKLFFFKAVHWLFLIVFPITSIVAIFSAEILNIWIGEDFANKSFRLMQIFSFGILVNCLAHIPYTLLQSSGKPRVTALIHCCQLPFYIALVWCMTLSMGVIGAALAWLVRIVVDTILLFGVCVYLQRWPFKMLLSRRALSYSALVVSIFSALAIENIYIRVGVGVLSLMCVLAVVQKEYKIECANVSS